MGTITKDDPPSVCKAMKAKAKAKPTAKAMKLPKAKAMKAKAGHELQVTRCIKEL